MRIYFHHNQNLNYIWRQWEQGKFPSHLLYGATHLSRFGIDVILHQFTNQERSRLSRALDTIKQIARCKEHFDAIYATRYNGIEFMILLRALGLYRKPIIVWQHQPIERSRSWWRNLASRFFFRGIDHLFFFSERLMNLSVASGKIRASQASVCPWGADLDFYDRLMSENNTVRHAGFISTGKENRDMPTLLSAFRNCPDTRLTLITAARCCDTDYEEMLSREELPGNVTLTINRDMWIPELALRIWPHQCVCICCKETNYTVGLTTLIEALAFGFPVIISRNPNQPFDAQEKGCGFSVPYGDVEGWKKAIRFITDNPEEARQMGQRARSLAETTYNITNCAAVVAETIKAAVTHYAPFRGQKA